MIAKKKDHVNVKKFLKPGVSSSTASNHNGPNVNASKGDPPDPPDPNPNPPEKDPLPPNEEGLDPDQDKDKDEDDDRDVDSPIDGL